MIWQVSLLPALAMALGFCVPTPVARAEDVTDPAVVAQENEKRVILLTFQAYERGFRHDLPLLQAKGLFTQIKDSGLARVLSSYTIEVKTTRIYDSHGIERAAATDVVNHRIELSLQKWRSQRFRPEDRAIITVHEMLRAYSNGNLDDRYELSKPIYDGAKTLGQASLLFNMPSTFIDAGIYLARIGDQKVLDCVATRPDGTTGTLQLEVVVGNQGVTVRGASGDAPFEYSDFNQTLEQFTFGPAFTTVVVKDAGGSSTYLLQTPAAGSTSVKGSRSIAGARLAEPIRCQVVAKVGGSAP